MSKPNDHWTFINSALNRSPPPAHPLNNKDWAGISFDRNRHQDLSPTEVWESLFLEHLHNGGRHIEIFYRGPQNSDFLTFIPPQMSSFREILDKGLFSVVEFYLASPTRDWLVRADYDVVLFCGTASFMSRVAKGAGGVSVIREKMNFDFFGGCAATAEGLDDYVRGLLKQISPTDPDDLA